MLILFDQGTPVPIRPYLTGHEVRTAAECAGFELLVTTDKNMRYQQNLAERKIAVIVPGQQQWPHVRPHVQRVIDAVNAATPGGFAEVDIPYL